MNYKHNPAVKIISAFVLFFFTWSFGGVIDIAYAAKSGINGQVASSKVNAKKTKEQGSAEKFQKTIEGIEQIISGMKDKSEGEINVEKGKLKTKKSEIETLDTEIKKQFTETEKKLKGEGLPAEILNRHDKFVRHYEDNLKELKKNLDAIDKAKDRKEVEARGEDTKKFLEKVRPPKRHKPLDPNKLPHSVREIKAFEITEKKLDTVEDNFNINEPVLIASTGSLDGLLAQASTVTSTATTSNTPPSAADLAESQEVQFTEELREITTLLENNPVYLYEFVRNNFAYEPYYGSVKGSQSTLLLQGGNDFDQASFLIALLRVSGIPARYVYGTVEIPMDKLMGWVGGVADPKIAAQIMATNGIPGKLIIEGGQIKYAQIEHVWVEAYIPYANYRGILNDPATSKTWIPLDPSFKLHESNPNATDLAALQNLDIDNFLTTYLQTVKSTTPAKEYLTNTTEYVKNNLTGQSFYDLLSTAAIIDKNLELLPSSLPYPVKATGSRFSTIPDSYRHRIAFEFTDPMFGETILSFQAAWSAFLHKRATLSYIPAESSDEQIIAAYGGIYSTPPYLIRVKPMLMIEGVTVAEGTAINMAYDITCRMSFIGPMGLLTDIETNILTAGAPLAIGLGTGTTTGRIITHTAAKLETAVNNGQWGEPVIGEYLNLLALNYLQDLDSSRKMISKTMKILDTNHLAELMVGVHLGVSYIFDIPNTVNISGLFIDVDYDISTPVDITGDQTKVRRFQILAGMTSSALEHSMFEATIGVEAVSAIKALQIARVQGIPVHQIDSNNIGEKLSVLQLSSEVKFDIQSAVQSGKVVIVSEKNVQLNNWNGVGYIVLDPRTGSGAYMLDTLSGGHLTSVASGLQAMISSGQMTKEQAKQYILDHRGQIWFLPPVEGSISSKFGPRKGKMHKGVDFRVPIGTSVQVVAKGKVTRVYNEPDGYGNVVYIDHGAGVETRYAHNSALLVSVGQEVLDGEVIAKSGNTGKVDPPPMPEYPNRGAHLHFEIRLNGEAVDPEFFLKPLY